MDAYSTIIAFDVDDFAVASELYLIWSFEGDETRFLASGSGDDGHDHG